MIQTRSPTYQPVLAVHVMCHCNLVFEPVIYQPPPPLLTHNTLSSLCLQCMSCATVIWSSNRSSISSQPPPPPIPSLTHTTLTSLCLLCMSCATVIWSSNPSSISSFMNCILSASEGISILGLLWCTDNSIPNRSYSQKVPTEANSNNLSLFWYVPAAAWSL